MRKDRPLEDRPVAKSEAKERDIIGSHPIGTGVGAVAGGVAAGAAVGTVAGPIGTAVGAAVGAVAGALAGKGIADMIDPKAEDEYWRTEWKNRSYIDSGYTYDEDYGPAYRYGVDSYGMYPGRAFDDVEKDMAVGWEKAKGESRLDWERAKHATKDSWKRVSDAIERATPGDSDRDGK